MVTWSLYIKGGQGREASTGPSSYDGSSIFDLYSSIRSSERSMPAALLEERTSFNTSGYVPPSLTPLRTSLCGVSKTMVPETSPGGTSGGKAHRSSEK